MELSVSLGEVVAEGVNNDGDVIELNGTIGRGFDNGRVEFRVCKGEEISVCLRV